MMKKDWSNYGFVAFLPFLAVMIVFLTEASARNSFYICSNGNCKESIPGNIWRVLKPDTGRTSTAELGDSDADRKIIALRYSGRMTWYFIGEIFLYVCAGSLAVASIFIFQLSPRARAEWTFGVVALSIIVGLFYYAHPEIHMAIFQTIFSQAISGDVPAISQFTRILNSLGNAALFSLLMAICVLLLPPTDAAAPDGLKQLAARMRRLRTILYTGTFLLVTAILLKEAVYQWTLAYIPQDDALETARNFLASLLTVEGGFYTLVLAAAYFPAALILHRRADLLVDQSVDEDAREAKLKEFGMNFSFKESLPRILAILGPFLTGPVGDFLNLKFF
jgi:hypothetical protein